MIKKSIVCNFCEKTIWDHSQDKPLPSDAISVIYDDYDNTEFKSIEAVGLDTGHSQWEHICADCIRKIAGFSARASAAKP